MDLVWYITTGNLYSRVEKLFVCCYKTTINIRVGR